MKVAVNKCFGGFRFSKEGYEWLMKEKGWTMTTWNKDGDYTDPDAQIVKQTEDPSRPWTMPGSGGPEYYFVQSDRDPSFRTNPDIIEAVETLGLKVNDSVANIKITEIPDDIKWHIDDYDGSEHIAEDHRTW